MISFSNSLGRISPCLLAVLIVGVLPVGLEAQTVVFRNDLTIPLVVQTSYVAGGVLYRDHSSTVRSGESTPKIKTNIDKIVTIYHGKSNQVLFRNVLKASKKRLVYGIVVEPAIPPRPGRPGRPARVNVILLKKAGGMTTMPKR